MAGDGDLELEIIGQVDSGLYGKVFRARQIGLDRVVAVKIIKPEYAHRADPVAHAKALARVGPHPNIVTIYAVQKVRIESQEYPAMVMEWLDGETFGARLGGERFSEQELRRLCAGVLDGVEQMHAKGMHHGDLHWGNVIVQADCHPKIIDIDASKERSLGRLSDVSRDGAISADIDYCRQLLYCAFAHSLFGPSLVHRVDMELRAVSSLAEIRVIVDRVLDRPSAPGEAIVSSAPAAALLPDELCGNVQDYIENNRPASLHGAVTGQVRLLRDELLSERFSASGRGGVSDQDIRNRIEQYEDCVAALFPALAVGCYWGDRRHWRLWKTCIETAANCYEDFGIEGRAGSTVLLNLRQYPALLLWYAAGLGAFLGNHFDTLQFLLSDLEHVDGGRHENLAAELMYWQGSQKEVWNAVLHSQQKQHTPVSDRLNQLAYRPLAGFAPVRNTFDTEFDRFEYFVGLAQCAAQQNPSSESCYAPDATFLRRRRNEPEFSNHFLRQAREKGAEWPPFQAGFFSQRVDKLEQLIAVFDECVDNHRRALHIRMLRR